MNEDIGSTEVLMIESGQKQISGRELRKLLLGNSVLGEFGFAFIYIMTIGVDGALEGINDVGSHHFGQLAIDDNADTLSVQWVDGWINSTSRVYEIDGKIKLYNVENGQWSTTFTKVLPGTDYPMEPPR